MAKEFSHAPEIERIAEKLIEMFKPELIGFTIRYVFNSENPKKDGEEKTALARKVVGLHAFLAGEPEGFFVLEFGRPAFDSMDEAALIAVVHHELCHFGISDDGNLWIIPHDVEEFSEVVKVHGTYDLNLLIFSESLEKGMSDEANRKELINRILNV
jgi:predicted metallopeptidase